MLIYIVHCRKNASNAMLIGIRSRERLCNHVQSAHVAIAIVSNFTTSPPAFY